MTALVTFTDAVLRAARALETLCHVRAETAVAPVVRARLEHALVAITSLGPTLAPADRPEAAALVRTLAERLRVAAATPGLASLRVLADAL